MSNFEQVKAYLKDRKFSEALECCEQCEEGEEKSKLRQKILADKEIWKWFGESLVLGTNGYCNIKSNPDVAIEKLTKAIELAFDQSVNDFLEEYIQPHILRGSFDLDRTELYTWRAEAYLKKNDYDAAIADFTKVIEHFDPPMLNFHAGACYYMRAEAYLKKGCYDIALEELAKLKLMIMETMMMGKSCFDWSERILAISAEANIEKAKHGFESGCSSFANEYYEKAQEMLQNMQNDLSKLWLHTKGKYSPEDSWDHKRYKKIEDFKKEIAEKT